MAEIETDGLRNRQAAVEAALRETRQDLFRFLVRRLRSEADAVDVLQDFYVKVLKSFADLESEDKLRPWMNRVLRSVIADHFRARARRLRLETDYEAETRLMAHDADDEQLDLLICACLYKLLPTLHHEYASLIWRADLLGEAREAIREDFRLSETAFRVKLHRARQALRRRLEQSCDACPEHGFLHCGCESRASSRAAAPQDY